MKKKPIRGRYLSKAVWPILLAVLLSGCWNEKAEDFSSGFPVCYRGGDKCAKFKFVDTSNLTYSYNYKMKEVSVSYDFKRWADKGLENGRISGGIRYMDSYVSDKGFGSLHVGVNEAKSVSYIGRTAIKNNLYFDLYRTRENSMEGFFIRGESPPFALVSCWSPFNGRSVCVVRSTVSDHISFDGRFVWTNDALSAMKFFGENFSKITNSIVEVK